MPLDQFSSKEYRVGNGSGTRPDSPFPGLWDSKELILGTNLRFLSTIRGFNSGRLPISHFIMLLILVVANLRDERSGHQNPREVTGLIVCVNCHLANELEDIEVHMPKTIGRIS
ncbi:hypothetical protein AMTR_s00155p00061210 [Amborella trichopoda]|uniref:Cytochrome f large domain-containing protein n=1 Tax=Amborella trichopoda TaxID=13333 RepID=W1PIZ7_AMBTC|nr:hypothetical protein AMTR_s00155p00061210 [Amborella trichopoda]